MLIMLKEIVGNETRDRTINPEQVLDIKETANGNDWCLLKMTDGTEIYVKGNINEITKRLNSEKRLLRG